ncbi:PHPT1, partial [Cervus elaphus hippelaphus]
DIYDKVSGEMQKKGYDCECLGGGRISHQSQDRKIHVYGYSMRFEVASTALELDCLPLPSPLYLQGHRAPRASSASGWRALPPAGSWCPCCLGAPRARTGHVRATFFLQGYGRAQHSVSTEKIKAKYPDYEVTWADDGY